MAKPSLWFRIVALCLAVGLGTGYVWKRQKEIEAAESEALRNSSRRILPGSKSPWGVMSWEGRGESGNQARDSPAVSEKDSAER